MCHPCIYTCLHSKPSVMRACVSYGSKRPVVSGRASLTPLTETKVKPETTTGRGHYMIPAKDWSKVQKLLPAAGFEAADIVVEGDVVYWREELWEGVKKQGGPQLNDLFQGAGKVLTEKGVAKFKEWLREGDKFVFVYWLPINRQDQYRVRVAKSRLRECTTVAELQERITKELNMAGMGNKGIKMWWSDMDPPDFDNLNKIFRAFVFADEDVPSTVDVALAWVLEEESTS